MSWSTIRFEKLYAEPSRNGIYKQKQFHGSGVRIVNMGELFAYDIISEQEMKRVAMSDAEMARSGLMNGDLLFGRRSLVEAGAGKCSLVEGLSEPATFESSIIRVRVDENSILPRFIFYWLKSHAGRGAIRAIVTGTNVKGIRGSVLKDIEVICPPFNTQNKIVEILQTYDDLIENNQRRMKLLDESARLLYQEWFVRLRFPGHEHTKIIYGVPKGWEKKVLSELCDSIEYGYTASAEKEVIGPKFLRITDIVPDFIDWNLVPYCPIAEKKFKKLRLLEGDIVIARTGATVGYAKRLHKRHPEVVFASYLVRLRLKTEVDNLMVGIFIESDTYKNFVKSRVGGAAQPNANAQVLASADILLPTQIIQREFHELIEPIFDERELLQMQIQKLKTARDLLLPKLMNGEIEV